jgi:hypothetical protein
MRQRVHGEMVQQETSSQFPVLSSQLFSSLLCCPQMWGCRWTARFLLLVMLVPAFGPMAMAHAARPEAMHCMRQPMSAHAVESTMPCHDAMAPSPPPQSESSPAQSSEPSFQATSNDNCCQNHCCCGATTSEWAQPVSSLLSFFSLLIETARPSQSAEFQSSDISGQDSARAPPRR